MNLRISGALLLTLTACGDNGNDGDKIEKILVDDGTANLHVRVDDGLWQVAPPSVDGVVTFDADGENIALYSEWCALPAVYFAKVGEFEQIDLRCGELVPVPTPSTLMGTINYAREAYYVAFASSWVSGASGGTYTMPVPTVTADLIATDITEQFESARIFIERDVAANGVVTRDIDLTTAPMLELSSQPGDTVDHTYTSLNTGTTDMGWFDAVAPYQYVALPVALRRSSDVYRISTLSRDGLQGEVDLDEWVDLPRALEVPANSLEVPTLSNMTLAWNWRPEFKDLRVSLWFGDPGGDSLDFLHLSASPQWAADFTSVDIEGLLQVADIDAGKPLDGADVSASIRNFEWDAGEPPVGSRLVRFTNGVTLGTANRQRPAQPVSATRGRWPRTGWGLRGNRM